MRNIVPILMTLFLGMNFLNAQTNIQKYGMGDLDIEYPKFKKKYLEKKDKYIDKFLKKNPHLSYLSPEELDFIYEHNSLFYRGLYSGFRKPDFFSWNFELVNHYYLSDSLYNNKYYYKNSFNAVSHFIIRDNIDNIPGFILEHQEMLKEADAGFFGDIILVKHLENLYKEIKINLYDSCYLEEYAALHAQLEKVTDPVLREDIEQIKRHAGDCKFSFDHKVINHKGDTSTLSEASAHEVVLVDFWATYCKPCIRSFPKTIKLKEKYSDRLSLLPVGMDGVKKYDKFIARKSDYADHLYCSLDVDQIASDYNIYGYPTYVLVNKSTEQEIFRTHSVDELEQFLKGYFR